jgi:hypothetical protein
MNDENQENERPMILTAPACVAVPGYGFHIALNPDWCFTSQERNASPSLRVSSRLSKLCQARTTTHQRPLE